MNARGNFSAVTSSSRAHVAKAHCAAARFAIAQPCCCLQHGGSCFDCQTGGKPLTQIARLIKKTDARSMRTRRGFYLESEGRVSSFPVTVRRAIAVAGMLLLTGIVPPGVSSGFCADKPC